MHCKVSQLLCFFVCPSRAGFLVAVPLHSGSLCARVCVDLEMGMMCTGRYMVDEWFVSVSDAQRNSCTRET